MSNILGAPALGSDKRNMRPLDWKAGGTEGCGKPGLHSCDIHKCFLVPEVWKRGWIKTAWVANLFPMTALCVPQPEPSKCSSHIGARTAD